MPIQTPERREHPGKLVAAGVIAAVLLIAWSMPRFVRALFISMVVLAVIAGAVVFL